MKKKAYLICPVRNITLEEEKEIDRLIEYWSDKCDLHSYKDVDQDCPTGYYIVDAHLIAMQEADTVLIYWNSSSQGSIFDLGMAIALEKPLQFIGGKPSEKDLASKSYYKVAKLIERFGYHRSITPDYPDWSIV